VDLFREIKVFEGNIEFVSYHLQRGDTKTALSTIEGLERQLTVIIVYIRRVATRLEREE